jgi:hypothetical protein
MGYLRKSAGRRCRSLSSETPEMTTAGAATSSLEAAAMSLELMAWVTNLMIS